MVMYLGEDILIGENSFGRGKCRLSTETSGTKKKFFFMGI